MHLTRTYLNFDGALVRPDNRRMCRSVTVFLRIGDIVVELARYVPPMRMDDAGAALHSRMRARPARAGVVDLVEVDVFGAHLSPNAVDVFARP
jgi:hypothetical protein